MIERTDDIWVERIVDGFICFNVNHWVSEGEIACHRGREIVLWRWMDSWDRPRMPFWKTPRVVAHRLRAVREGHDVKGILARATA